VAGKYDVIVVGGGPAGLAAAIASGRNGAKTLLIEQFGYLGGTATASLMINLNGFRNHVEPDSTQTVKGIAQEVILELHKLDGLGKSPYHQLLRLSPLSQKAGRRVSECVRKRVWERE
jgi:flavin-dependent dehydrogenase